MVATALAYLRARENAASWYRATPTSWLASVTPLLTPGAARALAAGVAGANPGFAWILMHHHRWQVAVLAACSADREAEGRDAQAVLRCQVVDRTVTATGALVSTSALPPAWPYGGAQPPSLLAMAEVGGRWLVAGDDTGRAQ